MRPDVEIAPFAIVRVAAISLRRVDALRARECGQLIEATLVARDTIERLRPRVEEHLFALVPELLERDLRSAAIHLRRDVHNGRVPGTQGPHLESIVRRLKGEAALDLVTWLDARTRLENLAATGEDALAEEVRSTLRPAVWAALDDPNLSHGIAIANPLLRRSLHEGCEAVTEEDEATKLELVLLRYLLRAACKTSPFATFMRDGIIWVEPEAPDLLPSLVHARLTRQVNLNRGIAARLYGAVARAFIMHDDIELRPNPTLRAHGDGGLRALAAQQIALRRHPWRQERSARFRLHDHITEIMLNLPDEICASRLKERLVVAGLTDMQATGLVSELMSRDLLLPPAVIDAFVEDPLQALQEYLRSSAAPDASHVSAAIASMRAALSIKPDAPWRERVDAARSIRATERDVLDLFGTDASEEYRLVYSERGRIESLGGTVGKQVCTLVEQVGRFLRDEVALRPEYIRLCEAFRARYGDSGTCNDVGEFLSSFAANVPNHPEAIRDFVRSESRSTVRPREGTRICLTAFVQVAAGLDELERGKGYIVVNRVYEGAGWLSARYASGEGSEGTELRDRITAWLERVCTPAEPLGLPVSGHCSDLQAHAQVTRRILGWPGEPIRAERQKVVPVGELVLGFGVDSGLLEFRDRDGRAVQPVYLGSVLPLVTWGPCYWLTVLGTPMRLLRPAPPVAPNSNEDVVHYPRQTFERVVLRRASWSVRSSTILGGPFRRRGFRRLVYVAEFCSLYGIPRAFFARAERPVVPLQEAFLVNARKPIFIDVRIPLCLDLLERLAAKAETVVLTEVLPTHEQAWAITARDRHVTELQVEMCISASATPNGSATVREGEREY